MLVLYVAEYLFHKVLKGHKSGGAAKLVNHHRHRAFFAEEPAHHGVGEERLRGIQHLFYLFLPVGRRIEELRHVHISHHIVYVVAVHQYLAASRSREQFRQLLARGLVDVHGYKLVARCHAVAQLGRREVKGIVEYLHLILHLGFRRVVEVVDLCFEIVVYVIYRQHPKACVLGLESGKAHKHLGQPRRECGYGIEHYIEEIHRNGRQLQRCVGVDAEHRLGDELSGEKYHQGRDDCLQQEYDRLIVRYMRLYPRLKKGGGTHAVHHQHYVVTHQYR